MKPFVPLVVLAAVFAAGCQTAQLADPNDPIESGGLTIENMRAQQSSYTDMLSYRASKGQLTDAQYHSLLTQADEWLLQGSSLSKVGAPHAWEYADILINAKHWTEAKEALVVAVEHAKVTKNEDLRVNDTLRLAHVEAELGDVSGAIATARSVFGVEPRGGAPILFAVSDEIAPAGRGKGHDLELAKLVEDAIAINARVEVDPNSDAGKQFIMFRPVHNRAAWKLVYELYTDAKRPDLAEHARVQGEAMLHDFTQDAHQGV